MHPGKLLVLLLLAAGTLGAMPAVVDNPPIFSVRGQVEALRTADFDHDTKLDFAALVWDGWATQYALVVYRGNGDGTFAAPQRTLLPMRTYFFDVGPIDGDAFPDLAIAGRADTSSPVKLRVVRGNGDGTFAAPGPEIAADRCSAGLTLADMTSDGRPDVVCGLTVFPSLGNGSFASSLSTTSDIGGYVIDATLDGRRDVVIRTWPGSRIYPGYGNGTFGGPISIPIDTDSRVLMAMGNFDGAGWLDYASVFETLSTGLANAGGSYGPPTVRGLAEASAMAAPDLNGDGRADLVAGGGYHLSAWIMGAGGVPGPRTIYPAAGSAEVLATGDFDADGSVDVLAGGDGDVFGVYGVISLFRGSASGALQGMRAYEVAGQRQGQYFGGVPNGAAASDVTGDGTPDLITVATAIPAIAVFAGLGDGTFAQAPQLTAIPAASWPAPRFTDFDEDGALDVIVSDQSRLYCFLANGDGTYVAAADFAGPAGNHQTFGAGDFNGDGHQDLVHDYAGTLTLRPGRGDGTFDAPVTGSYQTASSEGFRIGDVNNDGKDDLVFDGSLLLGSASGVFTRLSRDRMITAPLALPDLDGDGNLDLVHLRTYSDQYVSVQRGNGDGTFGPERLIGFELHKPGTSHPDAAASGDFNGDGHTDVAFAGTILLGDGAGSFNGFARARDTTADECGVADVDANGSSDLLCSASAADSLAVFRTRTAESLGLPLSLVIETAPSTAVAGDWLNVTVRATGVTAFAPTGAVVFSIGGQTVGLLELLDGAGYGKIFAGVIGTNPLTAHFGGDDVYAPADAPPLQVTISRATTVIDLLHWPEEAVPNQSIRFVGQVWSSLPEAQGTLTLRIDNAVAGTVPAPRLDLTIPPLPLGWHTVSLEYGGSASHLPSARSYSFQVVKPPIAMGITIDPPTGATTGMPVTVTVTFGDEPQLSGYVTIFGADGTAFIAQISNGVAALTTAELSQGSALVVSFPGNATYRATSRTINYTIIDAPVAPGPTSFYLVTPCRVFDTRDSFWPVASGDARAVTVTRRCGVPYGAKAVAVNVIVVSPQNSGYLTLYPGASPRPYTSTLNYRSGKTRANNAVLPLSAGGMLKVFNSGPASMHVILDVTGYFQ